MNVYWRCILALALAFALASPGCGDDESKSDDVGGDTTDVSGDHGDTSVGEDTAQPDTTVDDTTANDTTVDDTTADDTTATDTTDTTGPTCSADNECATGEVCNVVTGTCVANDRCLVADATCDDTVNHPLAFICADDGSGTDVCTATCNAPEDCSSGETCLPSAADPGRGACQAPDCTSVFDTTCGAGNRCYAIYDETDTFTGIHGCGRVTVQGQLGSACENSQQCIDGLVCHEQVCLDMCSPVAGTHACPTGSACGTTDIFVQADLGFCLSFDCDPIAGTGCAAGETCAPAVVDAIDNTLGGLCETAGTTVAGDACTVITDCAEGLLCVNQLCTELTLCNVDAGQPGYGACPTDAFCLTFDGWSGYGYCSEPFECELFSATTGCDAADRCLPDLGDSRNPAGLLVGLCDPVTTRGASGDACADWTDCDDGLTCLDDTCQALCDRDTATTTQGACATGTVCAPLFGEASSLGVCIEDECDPFATTSGCAGGEMCELYAVIGDEIFGRCVTEGTAAVGDSCTGWALGECGAGQTCLNDGADNFTCWTHCDPAVTDACGVGAMCAPFQNNDGETLPAGFCQDVCDPFAATTGCDTGEICVPDFDDSTLGYCYAGGTKVAGEVCTLLADCSPGLICAGTCQVMCDPAATTGEGVCASADDTCVRYVVDSGPISFGGCTLACSAGDPADACPTGQACLARELASGESLRDFCITGTPAATCTAQSANWLCDDGLALCTDVPQLTSGLACVELCREHQGAMLRVGHPDCSDPSAICDPSPVDGVGLCNAAQ